MRLCITYENYNDDSMNDEEDSNCLMIVNIDKDNKLADPLEAYKRYKLNFPGRDGNIN
jgi:hypothetical protein